VNLVQRWIDRFYPFAPGEGLELINFAKNFLVHLSTWRAPISTVPFSSKNKTGVSPFSEAVGEKGDSRRVQRTRGAPSGVEKPKVFRQSRFQRKRERSLAF